MAVVCSSRFSVLKLEDDEVAERSAKSKAKAAKSKNNVQNKKNKSKAASAQGETKTKPKKNKKIDSEIAELQNLAFSNGKTKQKKKSSASKLVNTSQKEWEDWKKKDSEFVSEAYEQDLQQALLLSKIDYEEKKDVYDAFQKESELMKQNQKKKKKSNHKKDKGTMSLDEFQNLPNEQIELGCTSKGAADLDDFELPPKPVAETDFFTKIEADAEKIIHREQKQEHSKTLKQPVIPESARMLQFQEEIRKKDEEIASLNETLKKLREDFHNVKLRNKKLCNLLISGEMREKAEILVQIEQLQSVKDELTEQCSEFHAALEQERSKVHGLEIELKKCQNKKNRAESK